MQAFLRGTLRAALRLLFKSVIGRELPERFQRVFFERQVIRMRGVGNMLERSTEDDHRGEREADDEGQRHQHRKDLQNRHDYSRTADHDLHRAGCGKVCAVFR